MVERSGIHEGDLKRLTTLLARAPEIMGEQLRLAFSKGIRLFKNHFVETRLSGGSGLRRGRHTSPAAWPVWVTPRGTSIDQIHARMWSIYPWMRIHEQGGTITARRRKMLAIPLRSAKAAGGYLKGAFVRITDASTLQTMSRFNPTALSYVGENERSLYAVPGLITIKSKKGQLLLGRGDPVTMKFTPLFVLKRSVTIKPRLKLRYTFARWARGPEFALVLRNGMRAALEKIERSVPRIG